MATLDEHWNGIFSAKSDSELGWYESDVSQTLKFFDQIPQGGSLKIFLPGIGTSILVEELLDRGHELILNDVSDQALDKLRCRIGSHDRVLWLPHDISKPLPTDVREIDFWIDRAVLHFLLEEADIRGYFANLQSVISEGGYVLLAEFSVSGAPKCAGLELHRYSIDEMVRRMGSEFQLIGHEEYTYINPRGDPRPYLYALFKRM